MASWHALVVIGCGACGFEHGVASSDVRPDVPPVVDVPPATPRWITVASATGTGSSIFVMPFSGTTVDAPCTGSSTTTYDMRALVDHPTLPYAYGIEADFHGFALGCGSITTTTLSGLGGPRPIQRVVTNADASVGFFTIDGPLAVGVYRFTTGTDGVPVIGGSANGPQQSGAIALVESDAQLFVAGNAQVFQYDLTGASLDLPTMSTLQTVCAASDLVASGDYLLAFCTDIPEIRRYKRSPFTPDSDVGTIGLISRVVTLPGDRAVAARISPSQLVAIDLHAGTPTWTDGPMLSGEITALAASRDGSLVVTARAVDPATSEVSVWSLAGTTFALVDSKNVAGRVTALVLGVPGT